MATSDNLSWRVVLTIEATALVCGTVYSLTRKFMNLTKAEGFAGNTTYFRHPLFQGLWCFLGQLLAWPIWWRMEQRERRRRQAAGGTRDVPLGEQPTSRRAAVLCMLPTLFDVIGTVLNNIGLILTSVSVYQMLRGSVVLFTSLASRLLLKTRFTTKQLQGLVMIAIGVCFIGMVRTYHGLSIRARADRPVPIGMARTAHQNRRTRHSPTSRTTRTTPRGPRWATCSSWSRRRCAGLVSSHVGFLCLHLSLLSQALMAGLFVSEETVMKAEKVPPLPHGPASNPEPDPNPYPVPDPEP